MIDTAPLSADPGGPVLRAINTAYWRASQAGKRYCNLRRTRDSEGFLSDHPNVAVWGTRYSAIVIGFSKPGKRYNANLALHQTHQPILRSYPEAMVGILEDAMHGIDRIEAFVTDSRKYPVPIGPQAFPYGAYPDGAVTCLSQRTHRGSDLWNTLKSSMHSMQQAAGGADP